MTPAAGFLYLTNSPIFSIEWLVADPAVSKEVRSDSLDELIAHIEKHAVLGGSYVSWMNISNQGLGKRLERLGYKKGDSNSMHFLKTFPGENT